MTSSCSARERFGGCCPRAGPARSRVDHEPAVLGADHPRHPDPAGGALHRHLHAHRHDRLLLLVVDVGNAAAGEDRAAAAGRGDGRGCQPMRAATRFRPRCPRVGEPAQPELQRVHPASGGDLVGERFHREGVGDLAGRAGARYAAARPQSSAPPRSGWAWRRAGPRSGRSARWRARRLRDARRVQRQQRDVGRLAVAMGSHAWVSHAAIVAVLVHGARSSRSWAGPLGSRPCSSCRLPLHAHRPADRLREQRRLGRRVVGPVRAVGARAVHVDDAHAVALDARACARTWTGSRARSATSSTPCRGRRARRPLRRRARWSRGSDGPAIGP